MNQHKWYAKNWDTLVKTYRHWNTFHPTRIASSLSYYGLFALVPVLVITFWISRLVFQGSALEGDIISRTTLIIGSSSTDFIKTAFAQFSDFSGSLIGSVIAIGAIVLLAYHGADELKQSLDDIWRSPERKPGIVMVLSRFLISLLAIAIFGSLFVFSITLIQFVEGGAFYGTALSMINILSPILTPVLLFLIGFIGTLIAFIVLPDRKMPIGALFAGAAVTALLLTVGNVILAFYLAHGASLSAYGVAGSIVALLLWFYYSALIFLFGASFTWVISQKKGAVLF